MTYYDQENQFLRQQLQKEIPILTALIQNLYQDLDQKFHLNGAKIPVTFGFETDSLDPIQGRVLMKRNIFIFPCSLLRMESTIRCQKRTVSIYSSMNMRITCSTICGYLRSINGRLEHMEVRGNIVVLL